jgi:phosphoesterase RecJ-like protein
VGSVIDTGAASTGELSYRLLTALGIPLDDVIARALYTSVVFDTQLFRYVKSKADSHLISADLLKHEKNPEEVHRALFSTYTVGKMRLLAQALSRVEYFAQDRAAFVALRSDDFRHSGLERDDSGDIVDLIMNIGSIEVAALVREDGPDRFKLSLRSKGSVDVLGLAEGFGGGGHKFASGAHISGAFIPLRERLLRELSDLMGRLS